jgi:hypothetical protein
MKKFLLLATFGFAAFMANGQNCTPNPAVDTLAFVPNPIPTGYVGQDYSETITFFVPRQINTADFPQLPNLGTITIQELRVTNVSNIPTGLTYAIFQENGNSLSINTWVPMPTNPPYIRGCVSIYGVPAEGTVTPVGGDSIGITAQIKIAPLGFQVDVPTFYIGYNIEQSMSVNNASLNSKFGISKIQPNPATTFANVAFNMEKAGNVDIRVTDMLGKQIESIILPASNGQNIHFLDVNNYKSGIYFYTISFDGKTATKKLVVN